MKKDKILEIKNGSFADRPSFGDIKINHSVIASITRLSTLKVEGVHSICEGTFVEGLAEMFSKKESDRGIRIQEDESGKYSIEIKVVLLYGTDLAKVALEIQQKVTQKVTEMTMKEVSRIDVIIDGIKLEEKEEEDILQSEQNVSF